MTPPDPHAVRERPGSVLLTGAAGRVGRVILPDLRSAYHEVRAIDRRAGPADDPGILEADLTDQAAAMSAASGMDAIVHLAGIPDEASFDALVGANVHATYNLLEAARTYGVRRVVLASSHHVIGFYPRSERIGPSDPVRPDSLYGVTKVAAEALGRLYHDKFGLEVICLRIGSFRFQPDCRRHLSTWLSADDLRHLVRRSLDASDVGFAVIFGTSLVPAPWWDNPEAARIDFAPRDRIDPVTVAAVEPIEDDGIAANVQGGFFADAQYQGGRG